MTETDPKINLENDPEKPKYYFPDDSDPPPNRGLPFDLLSLVVTLPEIPDVAQKELGKFFRDKVSDGVYIGSPELVEISFINGPIHIEPETQIHSGVSIDAKDGPVYIGSKTHIHPGVTIDGPVFIGDDCSIRHGAQLRAGTILGNKCVVGHSAEIKASICMFGAKMQNGVFVGNSILGVGARLGSGTILANRNFAQNPVTLGSDDVVIETRLKFFGAILGDYVRLGGNVVTNPGALVGPYTWVWSLVNLQGFVPRATRVVLEQEITHRKNREIKLGTGEGEYEHK